MVYERLKEAFDFVGVIDVERYEEYLNHPELVGKGSIFVVGLAYPHKQLKQQKDKLLASVYTYGIDYHLVLKSLMTEALKGLEHMPLVDNHNINERLCLEKTGLAFRGKNGLMIHEKYGSFFFIGLVITEKRCEEVIVENNNSCGDCTICIKACPVNALIDGFDVNKCMSAKNQIKEPLSEEVISKNYLLLGCDICQVVCPFNRKIDVTYNESFNVRETTYVMIEDMFNLSNKEFKDKYGNHAYHWRGKTLLLRNALTLLLRQKNTIYNEDIRKTILSDKYPEWYKIDAIKILERLENLRNID